MNGKYISLILFLASLLLFLIGFELVLRFVFPVSPQIGQDFVPRFLFQADPELGFKLTPNFKGDMKVAGFKTAIDINSYGLRGPELNQTKTKKRILFLGDSFTFGYGINEKDTFPRLLARLLNEYHPDSYEVINLGVMGYGTDQELAYFKTTGINLTPDIVVLAFFGGNDLSDNADYTNMSVINGFLVRDYNKLDLKTPFVWKWIKIKSSIILHKIKFLYKIKLQFDKAKEIKKGGRKSAYLMYSFSNDKYAWEQTAGYIQELNNLTTQNQMPLIVLNIPPVSLLKEKKDYFNLKDNGLSLSTNYLNIHLLDLIETNLSEYHYFSAPNLHFNKEGNKFVAESLFQYLIQNKLVG